MKISPLQLTAYFVTEFHFTLNTTFKGEKPLELKLDELTVVTDCKSAPDDPRRWVVTMELKYQPATDTNTPYIFSLGMIGMFEVSPKFDEARIERIVCTNGPSVLFGIAREIIRQQTARGPEGPFLLPSASFLPDDPELDPPPTLPPAAAAPSSPVAPSVTKKSARVKRAAKKS